MRLVISIVVCLVAAEGIAAWWMSPPPAGIGEPVLSQRPDAVLDGDVRLTPQPEIVAAAIPGLHCSDGMAARLELADGTVIHFGWFGWDHDTAGNVLHAFRHLPEECLGALGMRLVRVHPVRVGEVDGRPLTFDHTEFRDGRGATVHAFKAVWVSGSDQRLSEGLRTGSQAWRTLRMRAAAERFRPAHTRVVQGAVHRVANPEAAWELFEANVLGRFGFAPQGGG